MTDNQQQPRRPARRIHSSPALAIVARGLRPLPPAAGVSPAVLRARAEVARGQIVVTPRGVAMRTPTPAAGTPAAGNFAAVLSGRARYFASAARAVAAIL